MPKYVKQLKLLLMTAGIITFLMIIFGVYNAFQTVHRYKSSQVEMGNFILTSIKTSNRLIMRSSRFSQEMFETFVKELSNQKSINNIVVYSQDTNIILTFNADNQIPINTNFDENIVMHEKNRLLLYTRFKPHFGNNMMKRRNSQSQHAPVLNSEQDYFIAISLNMDTFNRLKKGEYIDLSQIVLLQLLLIFIFLYTLKLIKMFETSQKQLSIAKKEAELAKYSTTLAHEIKNPLSSIAGFVNYTKEHVSDTALNDYLAKATDEINRLNKIVNDFLQFGKEIQLTKTPLDIRAIIDHTLRLVRYEADNNQLSFNIVGDTFQIDADNDRMIQVVLNLLLNAVQAAPQDTSIQIELNPNTNQLRITNDCKDIKGVTAEQLFEPFYSTKIIGTGLGLSISKKILELHQFDIILVSSTPFSIQINFR